MNTGCEEIRATKHAEFEDCFVINLLCTRFNVSTYQALNSANMRLLGWTNDAQIAKLAFRLISLGRITKETRKYFIDVLCGDDILYTNADGTEAVRQF